MGAVECVRVEVENCGSKPVLFPDVGSGRADFSGADRKVERAGDFDRTEPTGMKYVMMAISSSRLATSRKEVC